MSTLLGEYTIGFGFPHYSFVIFELEMGSFESPYPLLCGQVIDFLSKSIFFEIINQTYIPQVSPRKTGQNQSFHGNKNPHYTIDVMDLQIGSNES
jgi:hypothetical protein